MSQPLGSPIDFGGNQPDQTALDTYQKLMAEGRFQPSTSITLPFTRQDAIDPELQEHAPAPTGPPTTSYAPIAQRRAAYSPSPTLTSEYSPSPTPTPTAPTWAAYPPHHGPPAPPGYYPPRATGQPANPKYAAYAPTSIMPRLPTLNFPPVLMSQPAYDPGHAPVLQQPIYTPDSITYDMVVARIQSLLESKLTSCATSGIVMLSSSITNHLISLGTTGELGPAGLESVNEIFMVVGHEGAMSYMALACTAPMKLRILLKGYNTDLKGVNALTDPEAMESLRQGFHNVAVCEWERITASMRGVRR